MSDARWVQWATRPPLCRSAFPPPRPPWSAGIRLIILCQLKKWSKNAGTSRSAVVTGWGRTSERSRPASVLREVSVSFSFHWPWFGITLPGAHLVQQAVWKNVQVFPRLFLLFSTSWLSGHLGKRSTSLTASSCARAKQAETPATVTAEVHWLSGWALFWKFPTKYFCLNLQKFPKWLFCLPLGQRWSLQPSRLDQLGNRLREKVTKLWKIENVKFNHKMCKISITFQLHVFSYRNRPGVYTRISEYRTWIRNVLRSGWIFQRIKVPKSESEQFFCFWKMHELDFESCTVFRSRMW